MKRSLELVSNSLAVASAVPAVPLLSPRPPAWVSSLLDDDCSHTQDSHEHGAVRVSEGGRFALLSTAVPEATSLSTQAFIEAVAHTYRVLWRELSLLRRAPLRVWNFLPDIHGPMGTVGDRYMAFNVGRFDGYSDWLGARGDFGHVVPTSSGVGITGHALWVHLLACDTPGISIENPRQSPSYRYTSRYGPRPPCFARATSFDSTLLIGGTASILGEESRHHDDVDAQTRETLRNISAVIQAAGGLSDRPLAVLRDVRVHVVAAEYAPAVKSILEELAPELTSVEFVQAELCRKELLVEIEGVASLS
jgi:enamine deaminase RidA (YjgF/YER057c/UK114 family)